MSTPRFDRLLDVFAHAGFARVEPAVLQPAQIFVALSGEDLRRRLYLTADAEGRELCLRPEFTIPVALDYLRDHPTGGRADRAYLGPVFRWRPGEAGEFLQAGAESFGRGDREAADAECLALALGAAAELGLAAPRIKMGDVGLFAEILERLALGPGDQRRLRRAFAGGRLRDGLAGLGEAKPDAAPRAALLATIDGKDHVAARAFVEDVLRIAGIQTVGGRTAAEIADRFLAQAAARHDRVSPEIVAALERFAAIGGDPDTAAQALRRLASDMKLDLSAALDRFEQRTGFIAAEGIDPSGIEFAADFGRNLDYYTGFVFELWRREGGNGKPLVGGGRYDGLLKALGGRDGVPAIGFSMWLDRFAGGGR